MRKFAVIVVALAALWLAPGALASNWCGTGETQVDRPDVTTGQQIHAVVIVPNDGADNFVADANILQNDVDVMSGWWSAQDPSRAPRFDQAVFPGGTCLDISFLRLPDAAAQLQGAGNAFRRVARDLELASFANQFKKYYVYYDGPAVEQNICGTGGGEFALGPAFAIVWLQGCPDIESVAIGTHELIHALGALTDMVGAPHACPGDTGHPCDSPQDILYPTADTSRPFLQELLDVGHDDYYAHSGSWPDIQDSLWLRHLQAPQQPLSVSVVGTGNVSSDVPGLTCGAPCTTQWDSGSLVTLRATAGPGFRLVRWTGDCTGNGNCAVNMTRAESVTAVFGPSAVALRISTVGRGTVRCTPSCARTFPAGKVLTLRAVAAKGWKLARWSGGCKGTKLTCRPATGTAITVRATFARVPKLNPKR